MAWTTPLTAVSNATLTAAQWNVSVRDNFLMTAPAVVTGAGVIIVGSGANQVSQRLVTSDTVDTSETTTQVVYGDISGGTVGPVVTLTTGPIALVLYAAQVNNSTAGQSSFVGWQISGATTTGPDDSKAISLDSATAFQDMRAADVRRATGLTAGSNTFKLVYRVSANTGTFQRRHLCVMGL